MEYPATRIVVTGSRNWDKGSLVHQALDHYLIKGQFLLGVGDCPTGADRQALAWGLRNLWFPPTVFHAPWEMRGKPAGPLRNQFMIDMFRPTLVLAFPLPESRGTRHCMEYAASQGILVRLIEGEGDVDGEIAGRKVDYPAN